MKLIAKYLKPFALVVLLCLILLFGQAMCDLSLPNLMSDIAVSYTHLDVYKRQILYSA